MDFLDSLDLHTTNEKSNRVRSWYLYEQYKSLEKSQLDAARQLKHRSYQDRILHRELSERRARRQFSEQFDLSHSESHIERTLNSETSRRLYSESTDSLFESICEREDVVNEKELKTTFSQHSETSKSYDEFKSSDNKINSCSESINSVVENTEVNENVANDIKDELEFVKKNIAEIINMQIETEKECLETYTELCGEKSCDNENINSKEKCDVEPSPAVDKYYPKYDSTLLTIWSKLVAFSYNVMQMNRGNCYYDYSSQFLTGVLAFDVLRRGINRMCHILQPYVSPIKFANDEYDASSVTKVDLNHRHANSRKSSKIVDQMYRPQRALKYNEKNYRTFERKYRSEDKWHSRCKYSFDNGMNEFRTRGASEPLRSVAKFSGGKNSFKDKPSHKFAETSYKDKYSSYCKCRQFKKAINPIIKLSQYIDMILREIED